MTLVATWFLFSLSVTGVLLNLRRNRLCFAVWSVTACGWMAVIGSRLGTTAFVDGQFWREAVYLGLALFGWRKWRATLSAT